MTTMTVTPNHARELLIDCLKARLVPMLTGSPGVGKSDIIHQIGKEFTLKVIDLRLSQCDPTDLLGLPSVDRELGKASYTPMDTFPLEGDPIPKGYEGWLLFLDEFNHAPPAVQKAGYKLALDRMVGLSKLHERCVVMGAGNKATDGALVEKLSTAMQSRLVHLEMEVSVNDWLEWARANGIDGRITSFINWKPEKLHQFRPDHNDRTFACPRTWAFTSRLIQHWDSIPDSKRPLIAGTISEGMAIQFTEYCKVFMDLATVEQIAKDPEGIKVPTEPSMCWATSGHIGSYFKENIAEPLMTYIRRLPKEFQVVTMREIVSRSKEMLQIPPVRKWVAENAQELF